MDKTTPQTFEDLRVHGTERSVVAAPTEPRLMGRVQPPLVSLISSAILVDHDSDVDFRDLGLQPDGCGTGQTLASCDPNCSTAFGSNLENAFPGCNNVYNFKAYVASSGETCSTFGFESHDYAGAARRKLLACESRLIEAELWSGAVNPANPHFSNDSANVPTTIGAGSYTMDEALRQIVGFIGDVSCGSQAMIHLRPSLIPYLLTKQLVRFENGRWFDWMGNIVVPGYGYKGTGPAGEAVTATSEWIYVTPLVEVHRGPVEITPEEGDMKAALRREANTITYFADRMVLAAWTPNCVFGAIEVDTSGAIG